MCEHALLFKDQFIHILNFDGIRLYNAISEVKKGGTPRIIKHFILHTDNLYGHHKSLHKINKHTRILKS